MLANIPELNTMECWDEKYMKQADDSWLLLKLKNGTILLCCYFYTVIFFLVSFTKRLKVPREITCKTPSHSNLMNPMVKIVIVPKCHMNSLFHANIKPNHIICISAVLWNQ